jgi:protein-glucosylgalactosylhydroxylysine glucosidase
VSTSFGVDGGKGVLAKRLTVRGMLIAAFLAFAAPVVASDDPSFVLSAGLGNLPGYFPGYLGNGFIATLSAPRGTEVTRSFLVGLMDYTTGDMSRPALIPGWNGIDFSSSAPGPDRAWLNRAPLNEHHFNGYRQTLDLRGATLTTRYSYLDRGRETAIEVVSLVSQASPHLAAMQFKITPDYDGVVKLSFPVVLWAAHAPRFPLGRMSGPEMEEAVAAHELSLEPRAPATPDREAVWYPGYTDVLASDGDSGSLSMWLDGRAAQGLSMALAATVALPQGITPEEIAFHQDHYRLALDVSVKVEKGRTYAFTKYVAMSREKWGGNASADLALAREARDRGFDNLLNEHRAAWDALWQADILIDGDARAQQAVHSELYYLLSNSTPGTAWALGACGLTAGYAGHIFWDSDTWIFPALLLLHPDRARSMVAFRDRTLDPADQRARERGFEGAMFPWESDPENGTEQTPYSAHTLAESELHVTAEVAIAQWQYYLATHDREWLRAHGWPVIRDVARFWASRATYDQKRRRYVIAHVTSVAESNTDVPNDTFTNLVAAKALHIATRAAKVAGERPDPLWNRVAKGLYIPVSADGTHHLPFDPSIADHNTDFGGGPVSLLFLPALDLEAGNDLVRGDYDFAVRTTPIEQVAGVSMGIAPRLAAAGAIGSGSEAERWFATNFTGGTLKPPFNVRTETASNNVGYFLTGSGGYLQSLLYGMSGLRIREAGLVQAYAPVLPTGWSSLTLHNLRFRGQRIDVRVARDASGTVRLTREVH